MNESVGEVANDLSNTATVVNRNHSTRHRYCHDDIPSA